MVGCAPGKCTTDKFMIRKRMLRTSKLVEFLLGALFSQNNGPSNLIGNDLKFCQL
jgi:hypothetical protein